MLDLAATHTDWTRGARLPDQLIAAATGLFFGIAYMRWCVRRRMARSRRIGRSAERRAVKLLRRAGYRIIEHQPTARVAVEVDGQAESFLVRGDLLVRRKRKIYLAEIKGGAGSGTIAHRATRRQLLEYATLFPVAGVLLVYVPARRIQRISFPALRRR